jgi:hypothetical protein
MHFIMRLTILGISALSLSSFASSLIAQAPTSTSAQRLLALRAQIAFQQQQTAVQYAAQRTAILVQLANQQNGLGTAVSPVVFQQQQMALQAAIEQTRALLQTGQMQRNAGLSRMALGQLNVLQRVLQQSTALQATLSAQSGMLTPAQLLSLGQQSPALTRLSVPLPATFPSSSLRRP